MSKKRILEIIPGSTTWAALILPVVLSFYYPSVVAIFILLFDLFWLYKALIMGYHLVLGYRMLEKSKRIDWRRELSSLTTLEDYAKPVNIYHGVILATYKEELDVLRPSVESIAHADYQRDRMIFVLAIETRDIERARANAQVLKREFSKYFAAFIVTEHPEIPGEMKAKGANATWAAKQLSKYIAKQHIDPRSVIVSTADADSRFHSRYFAALSCAYIKEQDRLHRSYQPIPLFANNIWDAPALARLLAFGSTFWQLIESTRPWRLINFSTHAMSLQLLQDIDYWDVTVVNEDSRQFWRAYYACHGNHQVVPIYLPVYMDAVLARTTWQTFVNQYKQRLRWAYGVEHFPYVVTSAWRDTSISIYDRIIKVWRLFEANFSWATASIYITFIGWLPNILNDQFSQTVLSFNSRYYTTRLLSMTWIGLLISVWISLKLLPPRPPRYRRGRWIAMTLQWVLIPVSAIVFGSIPAIDAQTRLMFGKYMGFWTTEKVRKQ